MVNQSDQYNGFTVDYLKGLAPKEGSRVLPLNFDFSAIPLGTTNLIFDVDLTNQFQRHLMTSVKCIYFDNSTGASDVVIAFISPVLHTVICPAGYQGFYPVIISGEPHFTVMGARGGSSNFRMALMNYTVSSLAGPVKHQNFVMSSNSRVSGAQPRLVPNFRATSSLSGQTAANGNTIMRITNAGETFFISSILVGISGAAQLAAPGELIVRIQSGSVEIMRAVTNVTAVPFAGAIILINFTDLGITGVGDGDDLVINLSAALTAGNVFYTVCYGFTQILSP